MPRWGGLRCAPLPAFPLGGCARRLPLARLTAASRRRSMDGAAAAAGPPVKVLAAQLRGAVRGADGMWRLGRAEAGRAPLRLRAAWMQGTVLEVASGGACGGSARLQDGSGPFTVLGVEEVPKGRPCLSPGTGRGRGVGGGGAGRAVGAPRRVGASPGCCGALSLPVLILKYLSPHIRSWCQLSTPAHAAGARARHGHRHGAQAGQGTQPLRRSPPACDCGREAEGVLACTVGKIHAALPGNLYPRHLPSAKVTVLPAQGCGILPAVFRRQEAAAGLHARWLHGAVMVLPAGQVRIWGRAERAQLLRARAFTCTSVSGRGVLKKLCCCRVIAGAAPAAQGTVFAAVGTKAYTVFLRVHVRIGPVFSSPQLWEMFDQTFGVLQRRSVQLRTRIGMGGGFLSLCLFGFFFFLSPVLLLQLAKCWVAALQELWYKIVTLLTFQSSELLAQQKEELHAGFDSCCM